RNPERLRLRPEIGDPFLKSSIGGDRRGGRGCREKGAQNESCAMSRSTHDHSPFQRVANASDPLASAPFLATIRSRRTLTKRPKSAEDMEEPMLQVPLEIAFHNIASSQPAEQEIRARVADLERLYPRLVSCRVRIDQRAKDLTGTIPPVVHIELGIPGR